MTERPSQPASPRQLVLLLVIPTLIGLTLRLMAAQGDYWLDEAWSAVFAREARTPGRVFFAINHDNNHYLNTLWLQLVGWSAPPMLGRAASIACGTASIAVAGLIGARRGTAAAALAAMLFAVSPILVTYGAEARGYAPMLLALLVAIRLVDQQLWGTPLRWAPQLLGVITLLGMLGHGSMLFGVVALTGWAAVEYARRMPFRAALNATILLMGRSVAAVAAVALLALIAALTSPAGFRMGSRTAFSGEALLDALAYMASFTLGWPFGVSLGLAALLLMPMMLARATALRDRAPFYLLAIPGLPLAVALLQPINSAFPRYYLLSSIALLLLTADLLVAARGRARWMAGGIFAALIASSIVVDLRIIRNLRGDPGVAITAMARRAPAAAAAIAGSPRDSAVLKTAAAAHGYKLRIDEDCSNARFLFIERDGGRPLPPIDRRCDATFVPIAAGRVEGLSGMDWQIYERTR